MRNVCWQFECNIFYNNVYTTEVQKLLVWYPNFHCELNSVQWWIMFRQMLTMSLFRQQLCCSLVSMLFSCTPPSFSFLVNKKHIFFIPAIVSVNRLVFEIVQHLSVVHICAPYWLIWTLHHRNEAGGSEGGSVETGLDQSVHWCTGWLNLSGCEPLTRSVHWEQNTSCTPALFLYPKMFFMWK